MYQMADGGDPHAYARTARSGVPLPRPVLVEDERVRASAEAENSPGLPLVMGHWARRGRLTHWSL